MISIILNGEHRHITHRQLNDVLLEVSEVEAGACAVALNLNFIPRSEYASTTLKDGDALELLTPMQGG